MFKKVHLALFFAVACVAAPAHGPALPPEPIPPTLPTAPSTPLPDAALAALRSALPHPQTFATLAVPVPQPAQVLTSGLLSCTVVGHYGAAQTRDGSFVVQVPQDGSAKITATNAQVSALNIPGDQSPDLVGTVPLPRSVVPGDSMVLLTGAPSPRPVVKWNSASGTVSEALAVVFVPYAVGPGLFCPPAIGRNSNVIVHFLRTFSSIPEALCDLSKVPSKVDLSVIYGQGGIDGSAWGAAPPSITQSLQDHRYFAADYNSDWRCAGRVPYTAHAGYGTFFAANISTAMLLCCSTEPLEQKAPLVYALCQRALHDLGRAADGAFLYPLGGHCWGRVPPMVLLGVLTGIDVFADPVPFVGARFPEHLFVPGPWWWGGGPWHWRFSLDDTIGLDSPPSLWGDPHSPTHSTFGWAFAYYGQVVPAQVGSAAAIVMLGGERFAPGLVSVARSHMAGPPAAARAQLTAAGVSDPNFGGDYGNSIGFAAACWRRYAQ